MSRMKTLLAELKEEYAEVSVTPNDVADFKSLTTEEKEEMLYLLLSRAGRLIVQLRDVIELHEAHLALIDHQSGYTTSRN